MRNLTIEGAGESQTTIDAVGLGNRVFQVSPGASVTITKLGIAGGHAPDGAAGSPGVAGANGQDGGAILNQGTLSVVDAMIDGSQAGMAAPAGERAVRRAILPLPAAPGAPAVMAAESSTPEC